MNTKELQYFMKVCEEQSINKAAGKLFITQQGLSRVKMCIRDRVYALDTCSPSWARTAFPAAPGAMWVADL